MEKIKISVADDDREIVNAICTLLEEEGYETVKAYNGKEVMQCMHEQEVQLILLDIMMPYQDGLTTTLQIRNEKNIPIIILSAKTEENDIVLGLNVGADDYIAKPYSPSELLARVRSQIRRYLRFGSQNMQKDGEEIIQNGSLELNVTQKQLYVDGEAVKLTSKEYKIINYLMHNLGRIFSAEEIYEHIWQEEAFSVENTVMVHIRRIREKIEINPSDPKYLKVVWGIGYKMEKYN